MKASLLLLVLLCLDRCGRGLAETPAQEVEALSSLFFSCNGESWLWQDSSRSDWNFSSPGVALSDPCSAAGNLPWEGITCTSSGTDCKENSTICHITHIYLRNYQLIGPIPPFLGNLTYLEDLTLWENSLTGTIPAEVSFPVNLMILDLDENFLHGTVPEEFYRMTNIKNLYLGNNLLSGSVPAEISNLTSLEYFQLSSNLFTGTIPVQLSMLTKIENIYFSDNYFSGELPSYIGDLDQLQNIGVSTNDFAGTLPSTLSLLSGLRLLNCHSNELTGTIPMSLGNLSSLLFLGLGINSFTGTIPTSLGDLQQLRVLGLNVNFLTSTIPREIETLTNLYALWLHHNLLTGQMPTDTNLLGTLDSLFVYNNFLTGTLPSQLGSLPKVDVILLHHNLFSGSLPSSISLMHDVETFDVSHNHLTGTIPQGIGDLLNLKDLELHDNYFSGPLPQSMGKLIHLEDLELYNNRFSSIPNEIGNITSLRKLFLQHNKLRGELSGLFWQPDRMLLEHMDLSGNLLEGSIATAMFSMPHIQTVALSINCLSGEIPVEVCSASRVNVLSLDGVSAAKDCDWGFFQPPFVRRFKPLEGMIPTCMWNMENLTVMHLSANGLTGTIGSFSKTSSIVNISLAHNRLSGTIPQGLQANSQLIELDLSYNKLTGEFKHAMPGNAERISVKVNRLSGRLNKGGFANVSHLDILEDNKFDCRDVPSNDVNNRDYVCESSDLDQSLYTMAVAVSLLASAILIVLSYRYFAKPADSVFVGIETEKHALLRFMTLLVNCKVYFGCIDHLNALVAGHVLAKISIFSQELFSILRGSIWLCLMSIILSIPIFGLKAVDEGVSDGEYSTYTHTYSWLISSAYISGELPAILLLLNWGFFMMCFVFFVWKFSKKYGDLFFRRFFSGSRERSSSKYEKLVMLAVLSCSIIVNSFVNVLYIFSLSHEKSQFITILVQVGMAFWKIFASVVLVPLLSKPVEDFENSIKTRLMMFIFNGMVIPCIVAMRVSPSCFETLFHRPDDIYATYSYEDCLNSVLYFETGEYVCTEYAHFSVDVPPLTPPFSYNYDCSSVILTAYIPVFLYMYALLALAPLAMMLTGVSVKYKSFPRWLQPRLPGILWPLHWSAGVDARQRSDSMQSFCEVATERRNSRVRTSSDMSAESSDTEGEVDMLNQTAEPQLMINVKTIVSSLMHNLFILATFGLCSPYLALMIVICNVSHIVMWKVFVGRFVFCRVLKAADSSDKVRPRSLSHSELNEMDINELMKKSNSATDGAQLALGAQLGDARGIFAICIWPMLLSSCFFFIFVSLDMAGDRVSWAGAIWIPAVFCVVPILVVWIAMHVVMRKRKEFSNEASISQRENEDIGAVELSTVHNTLHSESATSD